MQLVLDYDSSTVSAPAGFTAALDYAASELDSLITNNITVTIDVGWGEVEGAPIAGDDLAEGGDSPGTYLTYAQLVDELSTNTNSDAVSDELASLPANAETQLGNSLYVTTAEEKAWGLIPPDSAEVDGAVGFNSTAAYATNPADQDVPGEFGLVGIAEHEITHALGRMYGLGAFDLTDYLSPGVLNTSGGGGYFSLDGGTTNLSDFAYADEDPGDWASQSGDSFNYAATEGKNGIVSQTDLTLLQALGFSVAGTQFAVTDTTTGSSSNQNGIPYVGPVPNIAQEFIYTGSDSLNITPLVANSFIRAGAGDDAINVSKSGGDNVLDGSTGSNFLTGGSGDDTFFLDARGATSSIWSTVDGLHAGDMITLWGVTPGNSSVSWVDGVGAKGYTGLTGAFTSPGAPPVDLTLVGFSTADLAAGGRLQIGYGTTVSEPGAPGSAYTLITVT